MCEYPQLPKKGIPVTGTENYGGLTKIQRFRYLTREQGDEWQNTQLTATEYAMPATYHT